MSNYCVTIAQDDCEVPVMGVLLQAEDGPCVLSCLHRFRGATDIGKVFRASMHHPTEEILCEVVCKSTTHEFIVMKVLTHITRATAPVSFKSTRTDYGEPYLIYGYCTYRKQHWSSISGNFTTQIEAGAAVGGSRGYEQGIVGGPVFHKTTGELIGIDLTEPPKQNLYTRAPIHKLALASINPRSIVKPIWFIRIILSVPANGVQLCKGGQQATYKRTERDVQPETERRTKTTNTWDGGVTVPEPTKRPSTSNTWDVVATKFADHSIVENWMNQPTVHPS